MSEYSTVFGDTDNLPDTQEEEMKSKKANNKSLVTNNGD